MNLLDHLHLLMPAYVAYLVAIASPGPSNMAILELALRQGRRPALALAAGVVTASWTWAVVVATGLATLLLRHPAVLDGVTLVGGIYLLWLGWRAASAAVQRTPSPPSTRISGMERLRGIYARGVLMHLANPKAVLGWLAVLSLGLARDAPSGAPLIIVAVCAVLSVLVFGGYAIAFSVPALARTYLRGRRAAQVMVAVLFVGSGSGLLISLGGALLSSRS